MPIKIPYDLPAARTLRDENIFVMTLERARTQDIRPLRILVLNLMPTKVTTETQLARLLGNTPLQVELELLTVSSQSCSSMRCRANSPRSRKTSLITGMTTPPRLRPTSISRSMTGNNDIVGRH